MGSLNHRVAEAQLVTQEAVRTEKELVLKTMVALRFQCAHTARP